MTKQYVRWLNELRLSDAPLVGTDTALLGEVRTALSSEGVNVPDGFALTTSAYRDGLDHSGAWGQLDRLMTGIYKANDRDLASRAASAREIVYEAMGTDALRSQIERAYHDLEKTWGNEVPVLVRSTAALTALPEARFAERESDFVNIHGAQRVFDACRRCFTSLFAESAIAYRRDKGFNQLRASLSLVVLKMVNMGEGGVLSTRGVEADLRSIAAGAGYKTPMPFLPISPHAQIFLGDGEVLSLAQSVIKIEQLCSRISGHVGPIDIEWAKDVMDGRLYIVAIRARQSQSGSTVAIAA